jgi:4-amino-4-deoxy-L-arabinose transferase-like glycosyltransferase
MRQLPKMHLPDGARRWTTAAGNWIAAPPVWFEVVVWLCLIAAIAGVRMYLVHLLPVHLWSEDGGSYARSAWKWLETGEWETDPRRGPVYSLVIAACLKLWGTFDSVMVLQHVLGGLSILACCIVLRVMHGRIALAPIGACGYAFAVYGEPLHREHLIRNETLLLFFSATALTAWFFGLRASAKPSGAWHTMSGIAAGLLSLTKNVFVPFPAVVVGAALFLHRRKPLRGIVVAVAFVAAFVLPFAGAKILKQLTIHEKPPEPQSGLLLYGRVAQFTVLDGGIEPEIKALIRPDVEAYRAFIQERGKLDNNIPLNKTAVPRMRAYLSKRGKTPSDLNRLCRQLAFEAIAAHPAEYAWQVWRDFWQLQLRNGASVKSPDGKDVRSTLRTISTMRDEPGMRIPYTTQVLQSRTSKEHFRTYRSVAMSAWLFNLSPGLLTSLALVALLIVTRDVDRIWWLGLATLWAFTMVLLCTVGRPMDRYLIPALPVMFWSISSVLVLLWNRLVATGRSAAP